MEIGIVASIFSGLQFLCFLKCIFCAGEFDHVEYQGRQVKCRSSCEDQVGTYLKKKISRSCPFNHGPNSP